MGNIFKLVMFASLENALNLGIFTHAPVSHSELHVEFFKNLFPKTAERGGTKLYQNSIRKYEDDLQH